MLMKQNETYSGSQLQLWLEGHINFKDISKSVNTKISQQKVKTVYFLFLYTFFF
jgi:hypothetical protein